ncbi:MAG: IclR family transcriptional regulator C-terminal domain-containing protein [Phycisphaeraceae bacterium]
MTTPTTIPMLRNAMSVLEALANQQPFRSMTHMAKTLAIAPATCYRILKTYEQADWVALDDQGRYVLSLGMLPLLGPLLRFEELAARLRPALQTLAQEARLSAKLTVRLGDDAATIARAESPKAMSISGRVGARFSLAVGSSGSALLAPLGDAEITALLERAPDTAWRHQSRQDLWTRIGQCRRQGWCRDTGSFHPQVHSLSAPLRAPYQNMTAALTILGLPDDFGAGSPRAAAVRHLRDKLLTTARACERQLPIRSSSTQEAST